MATTLTLVRTVLEGSLSHSLALHGLSIRSIVPPESVWVTTANLPGEHDDQLFLYSQNPSYNGFTSYTYNDVDLQREVNGSLNVPTPAVGQAFFYLKAPSSVSSLWVQNFTVQ